MQTPNHDFFTLHSNAGAVARVDHRPVPGRGRGCHYQLGCEDTWKREFKLPWREAGPTNQHDANVVSDQ